MRVVDARRETETSEPAGREAATEQQHSASKWNRTERLGGGWIIPAEKDKTDRAPLSACRGFPELWLVDPLPETLDVFVLEGGRCVALGLFAATGGI